MMTFSYLSSSSFIEPPATGHHRWSGAKKKHFLNNIYIILQKKKKQCVNFSAQVDAEGSSAAVSALAVGGPLTAAGTALGRRLVAALVAAPRASLTFLLYNYFMQKTLPDVLAVRSPHL